MSDGGLDLSRIRRLVGLASIAYVSFPIAVWMLGWLAPVFASIGIAALVTGVAMLAMQFAVSPMGAGNERRISWWEIAAICVTVGVVIGLTGAGGFGVQTGDWLKHNAILSDLINQPWPVAYSTSAGSIGLVYYVAYYLPAALIGKLFGWVAANLVLYVWTVFGGVLVVLWLVVSSRATVWLCLLGFTFFAGLDVVGELLRAHGPERWTGWINNFALEWWEGHWLFPGNVSLIAYVPQQALGGWLLTGLTLDRLRERSVDHPYVLTIALALMWSPYVAIGLVLLTVVSVDPGRARLRRLVAGQLSLANLAGVVLGGICSVYFLGRLLPVELADVYVSPASAFERGAFAVGLSGMSLTLFVQHYLASVVLEFLMLSSLLALVYWRCPAERRIVIGSAVVLSALPFFHHGHYNDLVMRVSIPLLFALLVLTLGALATLPSGAVRTGLVVLLVVGAIHPANMLLTNVREIRSRGAVFQVPQVFSLFEQQIKLRQGWPYLYQYVCPLDAFFFRHMARPPIPINHDP